MRKPKRRFKLPRAPLIKKRSEPHRNHKKDPPRSGPRKRGWVEKDEQC